MLNSPLADSPRTKKAKRACVVKNETAASSNASASTTNNNNNSANSANNNANNNNASGSIGGSVAVQLFPAVTASAASVAATFGNHQSGASGEMRHSIDLDSDVNIAMPHENPFVPSDSFRMISAEDQIPDEDAILEV